MSLDVLFISNSHIHILSIFLLYECFRKSVLELVQAFLFFYLLCTSLHQAFGKPYHDCSIIKSPIFEILTYVWSRTLGEYRKLVVTIRNRTPYVYYYYLQEQQDLWLPTEVNEFIKAIAVSNYHFSFLVVVALLFSSAVGSHHLSAIMMAQYINHYRLPFRYQTSVNPSSSLDISQLICVPVN